VALCKVSCLLPAKSQDNYKTHRVAFPAIQPILWLCLILIILTQRRGHDLPAPFPAEWLHGSELFFPQRLTLENIDPGSISRPNSQFSGLAKSRQDHIKGRGHGMLAAAGMDCSSSTLLNACSPVCCDFVATRAA
jgi:hypothetical protein